MTLDIVDDPQREKCGLKYVIHSLEGLSGLHMLTKKKAEP